MSRYHVRRTIGSGLFGTVYQAYDTETSTEIAIKVFNSLVAQDRAIVRELLRHIEKATILNHKNIIRLFGVRDDGERKFLTMEYADASSLADLMTTLPAGKIPIETALNFAEQIIRGLEYAHSRKIPHLDLKLKNILLTGGGTIKLGGFGVGKVARALTTRLTSSDSSRLLVNMAPEQLLGEESDPRSDIYALGCILYQLLSGKPPLSGCNLRQAILTETPAPLAGVAESINAVLQKALAKDKSQRWNTAAEMGAALSGHQGAQPLSAYDNLSVEESHEDSEEKAFNRRRGESQDGPSLLDEYRKWIEGQNQLEEFNPAERSLYKELKRVEHENSRLKFLEETYSSEQEKKERAEILRIEADHFASKIKKREERATVENGSFVRMWSVSITVLMGVLLTLFVYKLNQEEMAKAAKAGGLDPSGSIQTTGIIPPQTAGLEFRVRESTLTTVEHDAADAVQDIHISPDTSKVTYKVRLGQFWHVAIGGQRGPAFDSVDQVIFSAEKNKVAYKAGQDGRELTVLNQKSGPLFDGVDTLSFSPNGAILAYIARQAKKFFVVSNNRRESEYDWVGHMVFSPDSRKIAYAAKRGAKAFVVFGKEKGQEFAAIGDLVFSPDSLRLAYAAREGNHEVLVVGEERGEAYDKVSNPVFSPDSKNIAYVARKDDHEFIVTDNHPSGAAYDSISGLRYSPDGKTISYIAHRSGKAFLVSGDNYGPEFEAISDFTFSPNNQASAYVAHQDGRAFVLLEGQKGPVFEQISGLTFSSDSQQVAYIAKDAGKQFIVVGNKRGPALDEVWRPVFSPDSRKVLYGARVGNSVLRVEMSTL